jgi:hypothetical protein
MFASDREGGVFNLYQKLANGAGSDERIVASTDDMAPYSWWQDLLLYRRGISSLGILPLVGDRTPRAYVQSPTINQTQGQVSPNGRWVALHSTQTGRYEIWVRSFPNPNDQSQISTGGAAYALWRGDGRELFYYAADGRLMATPVTADRAFVMGATVPLFEARMLNGPGTSRGIRHQYDVARDGQRFLLNVPLEETVVSPITVIVNWAAGLKN